MTPLAEKYRPASFEDFKGSEFTVRLLTRMVESGKLPSCLLFSGNRGSGKTSSARIIAAMLNGEEFDPMSYIEIDAASNSGVDNIRSLQESIMYSHSGNWRVVVLDEAQSMSSASFNALLKVLEEPPPHTLFILVTTHPEALPETVRSRAMEFRFQDVPMPDIARRLAEVNQREGGLVKDPHVIVRIAEVADGSLRTALILLQQIYLVPQATVEDVNELSGFTASTRDLLYAMKSGDIVEFEAELSHLMGKTSQIHKVVQDLGNTLKDFYRSGVLGTKQFLSSMEVVWNLRKVAVSSDSISRSQLEAGLFFMFSKAFWDGQEANRAAPEAVLTMEDIEKATT